MQAKLTINKTTKPFEPGPHATLAQQRKSSSAISINNLENNCTRQEKSFKHVCNYIEYINIQKKHFAKFKTQLKLNQNATNKDAASTNKKQTTQTYQIHNCRNRTDEHAPILQRPHTTTVKDN